LLTRALGGKETPAGNEGFCWKNGNIKLTKRYMEPATLGF
jgi:hypothetical protein